MPASFLDDVPYNHLAITAATAATDREITTNQGETEELKMNDAEDSSESEEYVRAISGIQDFDLNLQDCPSPFIEEQEEEEVDDLFDPDLIEVPKLIRKMSANMAGARFTRMLRKKLFEFVRFSGLTGIRTVSDELSITNGSSSDFEADSDQTLHSNRDECAGDENPLTSEEEECREKLRSSLNVFMNPLDAHFSECRQAEEEYKLYDLLAVNKRVINANWLAQLVIEKIEKTIRDVEVA